MDTKRERVDTNVEDSPLMVPMNSADPVIGMPLPERSTGGRVWSWVRANGLLLLTIAGVALGFIIGFAIHPSRPSESALMWIGMPGELYMRSLKVTILPLIVSSVIAGTASMDVKSNGKVSAITVAFIFITNTLGVTMALLLFYIFNPGSDVEVAESAASGKTTALQTEDILADMIRNIMPDNIITSCFQKVQTRYPIVTVSSTLANGTVLSREVKQRTVGVSGGTNILGLIILSTLVGMATSKVGEVARPFINFFKATSEVIIMVLRWLVWMTPLGVASMIANAVGKVDDLEGTFRSLGIFVVAFVVGIVILVAGLCPITYFLVVRKNPFIFLYTTLRPFMTAFATASSAVAIPEVLNTCELKHGVNPAISRFVVSFATALNRTGSCIFITLSCLFICRLEGIELEGAKVLMLGILSTVSSLAIPAVPSGSIICILIILSSVGVVTSNIGLLMSLEWFTDRLRTGANVVSIVSGAVFIHVFCNDSNGCTPDERSEKAMNSTNQNSPARRSEHSVA